MTQTIFDQLVQATSELLGPASERFIERQVDNHLNIDPKKITPEDVAALSEWIRISISMLTDDKKLLRTYNRQLENLSKGQV